MKQKGHAFQQAAKANLRNALSNVTSDINLLSNSTQTHPSHYRKSAANPKFILVILFYSY
jgi:hypothetical protein